MQLFAWSNRWRDYLLKSNDLYAIIPNYFASEAATHQPRMLSTADYQRHEHLLYSRDTTIYIYIYICGNKMTNEHTSSEKYTSHTLCERVVKGLCVRGELETEQTATYWPPVPLTIAALLFLILLGCSIGSPEGPSPLLGASSHCLELQLELQLPDSN